MRGKLAAGYPCVATTASHSEDAVGATGAQPSYQDLQWWPDLLLLCGGFLPSRTLHVVSFSYSFLFLWTRDRPGACALLHGARLRRPCAASLQPSYHAQDLQWWPDLLLLCGGVLPSRTLHVVSFSYSFLFLWIPDRPGSCALVHGARLRRPCVATTASQSNPTAEGA